VGRTLTLCWRSRREYPDGDRTFFLMIQREPDIKKKAYYSGGGDKTTYTAG